MLRPSGRDSCGNSRCSSASFLNFKCCAIGDTGVGKTSMLMAYCVESWRPNKSSFIPATYVPNRPFIIQSAGGGTCITLTIKDTRGGQETDDVRAFDCSGADCLLICYSTADPESFFSVEARWLPFKERVCPDAACILVGTKTDLRPRRQQQDLADDSAGGRNSRRSSTMEITSKMGAKLAKKIHAFEYLECSSMDKESLDAVFNTAIRTFTGEASATGDAAVSSAPPTSPKDKTDSGKKCQIS